MTKLDALWQYHEAVQKHAQLEARIKSTPQRQRLNQLHGYLSEQQTQLRNTQTQLEARKASVEKLSALFESLQRQYELELNEFEAMERDSECTLAEMREARAAIEALCDKANGARRELNEIIAWIEKAVANYKSINAKAGKAKKEYDAVRAACEKEAAQARPELNALEAEIKRLCAKVDTPLLKKYEAVRSHHAVPLAKVENNQCGGCNMSLPTSVVKRVASASEMVECENCGRILYIE